MKIIHLPSGGKFYQTPCGLFPSVTTILQAAMPENQRKRLMNWHQRNGSEAEILRQQAAERGKAIHSAFHLRKSRIGGILFVIVTKPPTKP